MGMKDEIIEEAELEIKELCYYMDISRTFLWQMRNHSNPFVMRFCPLKRRMVATIEDYKAWHMANPDFRCK